MEIEQKQQINKIQQEGFDEKTKLKIQAYLDEINQKQQQQKIPYNKTKYIKFPSDRERKLLYFTGKFDKKEVPETDFQTGEAVPGKYKIRYTFECYDITTSTIEKAQTRQPEPSIWERGIADARTILYYLSIDKKVLEVIRNGQPGSTSTTYQIHPPLD